jgi:undecaprenyl-phosphate 4-deoxy-4-formamido-L-arabinose transferase
MLGYSVVIPVYNSEATLLELYNRIQSVFKNITSSFEIIFVDDGSRDKSWQTLKELRIKDKRVKIIQLMRNFGQHNAIMCAFHFVHGEYIITMDDDLQNPPEEIPKLINKIKEGYDLVYGEYIYKKHNLLRNIGSSVIQLVYKRVFNVCNNLTSFRIIKKELVQSILNFDKNYVFIDGLLAWNTKNIGFIPVLHYERKYGKSGYRLKKLLTLSLNMITNFSIVPLQIASLLGLLFAFAGFFMAMFFFVKKIIFDIPVSGYTSLIIAITIFSGVQLLTLGLIGEYIGRIHININKKPQYEIRIISSNDD